MISELTKINYALIVADSNELHDLSIYGWNLINKNNLKNKKYYIYSKNDKQILLIHSGIGIVNAASATQLIIDYLPNLKAIFSHGAVGAFADDLNIYDLVIPQKIYFYDVDTPWYSFGQTPGEKEYYQNSFSAEKDVKNHNLGSGNSFLYDVEKIQKIQNQIPINIFDMEAAAIAQISTQNQIPFYLVKSISDKIGEKVDIKENINFRIAKATEISLRKILEKIEEFF